MIRRILALLLAAAFAASAQKAAPKYSGPVPPKPDLPYLKHADNLIPTESVDVKEEKKKDEVTYIMPGATSPARTPLASPIFLFLADKYPADHLGLYKLESKSGRRELAASSKRPLQPIRIEVTHLSGNIYRIEVDESLEPGQYALSPEGPNLAFCFEVF